MDTKLSALYYSPMGYWKGLPAIKKLAEAAKVSQDVSRAWLKKQAIWQIYLPAPRRVPRPKFDVSVPNEVYQEFQPPQLYQHSCKFSLSLFFRVNELMLHPV